MLHIYCGDGKGKTTAAVGLAVRMAGYGKCVLFMQFLKGSQTGEKVMLEKCDNVTVLRCNACKFFINMTDEEKQKITQKHNDNLKYALDNMSEYDLIVLDEVLDAIDCGVADVDNVKEIVSNYNGELVLTGRKADKWLIERADYITEMKKIKHPYDDGMMAREGVEY